MNRTTVDSPDDFSGKDPHEIAITRRKLLLASGLVFAGIGVTDEVMAASPTTKKRKVTTKNKATTKATTKANASATTKASTSSGSTGATGASATGASATGAGASGNVIPAETGGPFPGDGTNGPNVLNQAGVVRRDIRSSFGNSSTAAKGLPLIVRFDLRASLTGFAPMNGAAVYAWHCDAEGRYSMYSPGVTNENFLRGVGEANANGVVEFLTVFPGAYQGRWPHVHFEVYESLKAATSGRNAIATSQIAFTPESCKAAYATSGYSTSARIFSGMSLDSDMIFADGYADQLATMSGSGETYAATLRVNV